MRDFIRHLDKAFENRLRLGIMSVLVVTESADFTELKERLGATDGNLASHLRALEKAGYVEMEKRFVGRKPNTLYRVSPEGRKAFRAHLDALEKLIRGSG